MKLRIYLFLIILSFVLRCNAETPWNKTQFSESFQTLDSLLKHRDDRVLEKEKKIDNLKVFLNNSTTDAEKLVFIRLLFQEYDNYNTESALYYAREELELLKKEYPNNQDLQDRVKLRIINTLIMEGNFEEASKLLSRLNPKFMNPDNKAYYYEVKEHYIINHNVFMASRNTDWDAVIRELNACRDSIMNIKDKNAERWLWIPLARKIDLNPESLAPGDKDALAIIDYMKKNPYPSEINAHNAYWLSRYYNVIGDEEEELKYLLEGSILKEELLNREIVTLQDLAAYLFRKGDYSKAYNYIIFAINNANDMNNRPRVVDIVKKVSRIGNQYRMEKIEADRKIHGLVISLSIISGILLVAICIIVIFLWKIRKKKVQLQKSNSSLHKNNVDLKLDLEKNSDILSKLKEEKEGLLGLVDSKNEVIISSLMVTSEAFREQENYRRKLLKLFRENKTKELGVILNDPEFLKEVYQDFYVNFDKTLLKITPGFISFYNSNVPQEFRVDENTTKKRKTLNTRMRIFALMRLGLDKSSEIAKILNISPQTVYNTKSELHANLNDTL